MHVYSYNSSNQWNLDKSCNYLYKSMIRSSNHIGNYWDEYEGSDEYESGIGKIVYCYQFIIDRGPLVFRKELYQILI